MSLRFSPRPNRANEIQWRAWNAATFAEAAEANKPILLNLTAMWCHWCHLMDETTYSDPSLIQLINDNLIPLRVDADQHPHVQDRYIAGGWPTNAFLTPTGEVLWSGTYVPPEQFTQVAGGVLTAWAERRDELKAEIERRRKALAAARGRHHVAGLVRREAGDDVLSATIDSYDARNGGFGDEPKFPYVDAIELLLTHSAANADYLHMAEHSLDGMLSGELWDAEGGGFFRYATAPDWTAPRYEKLLTINAGMLRVYALGAQVRGRQDWRSIAERLVGWVDAALAQPGDLWAGSQAADNEYYALPAAERRNAPAVDAAIYTSYNAQWIAALASAGARLSNPAWIERAQRGLDALLDRMAAPGDLMFHYKAPDAQPDIAFLLADTADTANACITVAQATGNPSYINHARRLATALERTFWAEDGGFWDRAKGGDEFGVLRYRDKPFDLNTECAHLLLDLSLATGERSYRALTERVLALLSPQAGRYGVAAARYALVVEDFFETPLQIIVTGMGDAAHELRAAANSHPVIKRRVWSLPEGGRIGQLSFPLRSEAAAYIASTRGVSQPVEQADRLHAALTSIR